MAVVDIVVVEEDVVQLVVELARACFDIASSLEGVVVGIVVVYREMFVVH